MARGSSSNGKRARSAGRGGRRVVLAGRGDGWEVWIPEDDYRRMSEAERAAAVERQRALLDQVARASTVAKVRNEKKGAATSTGPTERRPRRGASIAGVLDLAGALQLALL